MKKQLFIFLLLFSTLIIQSKLNAQSTSSDYDEVITKLNSLGSKSGSIKQYFTDAELMILQEYKSYQNAMQIQLGGNLLENNDIEYVTKAYGYEAFMPGNISFDIETPSLLNIIGSGDPNEFAGAINPNNPTEAYTLRADGGFYSFDITTGESTLLGTLSSELILDLAFNPVDNVLYAVSSYSLYSIDPEALSITYIGYLGLSGESLGFAIDGNGDAYVYDYDDIFYSVDLSTGASDFIGGIGFDAEFAQAMSWDPESNKVYMTAFNYTTLNSEFRSVDLETGMSTYLGQIGTSVAEVYWVSFVTEEAPETGNCDLSGNTSNGEIWDRPIEDGTEISTDGVDVKYHVYGPFTVDTTGEYTIESIQMEWDGMIFIYENNFDPSNPLENYLDGNDDMEGVGMSQIMTNLNVGTSYFLITTGYEASDFGIFNNSIAGPGTVSCEEIIEETCDWTVIVSGQTYGHFISWTLKHEGLVLLSGGQYITDGFYDEKHINYAGPVDFHIESGEDELGGSLTYTIANGTEIIAMGQIVPGQQANHTDLACGALTNGCLEAPLGQFPSTAFSPECTEDSELISDSAKTGQYTLVNLAMEKQYVFSSSVATDFITISNEDGTEIFATGIGSLQYISAIDQTVRFYLHLDENCTYSETDNRSKSIQCSEILGPPLNDTCENAIEVNCGDSITGNTYFSTNSGGNPANDVYYKYTGTGEPQHVELSLCNANYDTTLRVFTDCSLSNEIIYNDDFCGTRSKLTFYSDGTSTYYIMVEGYGENIGTFVLDVTCEEDIYDVCEPIVEGDIRTGLSLGINDLAANDFNVLANTQYEVGKINLEVISSEDEPTTFTIKFYEGENGVETQIGETIQDLAPTYLEEIGTFGYFNEPVFLVELTLPQPIIFPSTPTSDKKYWVAIGANSSISGGQISWASHVYYSPQTLPIWKSIDGGTTWNEYEYGDILFLEGNMSLEGECEMLGMSEIEDFDFAYYPNPVKDVLHIQTSKTVESIELYKLAGQKLMTNVKLINGQLNLNSLNSGTYFIRLTLEGNQIETFKIIKK